MATQEKGAISEWGASVYERMGIKPGAPAEKKIGLVKQPEPEAEAEKPEGPGAVVRGLKNLRSYVKQKAAEERETLAKKEIIDEHNSFVRAAAIDQQAHGPSRLRSKEPVALTYDDSPERRQQMQATEMFNRAREESEARAAEFGEISAADGSKPLTAARDPRTVNPTQEGLRGYVMRKAEEEVLGSQLYGEGLIDRATRGARDVAKKLPLVGQRVEKQQAEREARYQELLDQEARGSTYQNEHPYKAMAAKAATSPTAWRNIAEIVGVSAATRGLATMPYIAAKGGLEGIINEPGPIPEKIKAGVRGAGMGAAGAKAYGLAGKGKGFLKPFAGMTAAGTGMELAGKPDITSKDVQMALAQSVAPAAAFAGLKYGGEQYGRIMSSPKVAPHKARLGAKWREFTGREGKAVGEAKFQTEAELRQQGYVPYNAERGIWLKYDAQGRVIGQEYTKPQKGSKVGLTKESKPRALEQETASTRNKAELEVEAKIFGEMQKKGVSDANIPPDKVATVLSPVLRKQAQLYRQGKITIPQAADEAIKAVQAMQEPAPEVPAKIPLVKKPKKLSYKAFSKQYKELFALANKYTPDQVGSVEYLDKMAALGDQYPKYLERLEKETDAEYEKKQPAPEPAAPAAPEAQGPPPSEFKPGQLVFYVNRLGNKKRGALGRLISENQQTGERTWEIRVTAKPKGRSKQTVTRTIKEGDLIMPSSITGAKAYRDAINTLPAEDRKAAKAASKSFDDYVTLNAERWIDEGEAIGMLRQANGNHNTANSLIKRLARERAMKELYPEGDPGNPVDRAKAYAAIEAMEAKAAEADAAIVAQERAPVAEGEGDDSFPFGVAGKASPQDADVAAQLGRIMEKYEAGDNDMATVEDVIAAIESGQISHPLLDAVINKYNQAANEDRFEYGMRSGLPEDVENEVFAAIDTIISAPERKMGAGEPNEPAYETDAGTNQISLLKGEHRARKMPDKGLQKGRQAEAGDLELWQAQADAENAKKQLTLSEAEAKAQEELNKEPKANWPVGAQVQMVGGDGAAALPLGPYEYKNPDVEAAHKRAHGAPGKTLRERIAARMEHLKGMLREYEHLPNVPEYGYLRFKLHNLDRMKGAVIDRTIRMFKAETRGLDQTGYNVMERYLFMKGLLRDVELGKPLPNEWTPEELKAELARVEPYLTPRIKQAIEMSYRHQQAINAEYTKALKEVGIDMEGKFEDENYFHHDVLDFLATEARGTGKGKHIGKKGFLKHREGTTRDVNTNYLEAMAKVRVHMLNDIEVAKTLGYVDKTFNVKNDLKAQAAKKNESMAAGRDPQWAAMAAEQNEAAAAIRARKGTDLPEDKSPVEVMRGVLNQKQAIGFQKLGKLAEEGYLKQDEKAFGDVIRTLIVEYNNSKEAAKAARKEDYIPDFMDDTDLAPKGRVFEYLSYVMDNRPGTPEAMGAATIFKGIRAKRAYFQETLGDDFVTWKEILPEGYKIFQPEPGRHFFQASTLPQKMVDRFMESGLQELGISKDDIRTMLAVGGPKAEWVLPEAVALTIDKQSEFNEAFYRWIGKPMSAWKEWQLISPRRMAKYNIRNMSGDADGMVAALGFGPFKHLPRAMGELYQWLKADRIESPEMQSFVNFGPLQSTLQAAELRDISKLDEFQAILEREPLTPGNALPRAWSSYWHASRGLTDYRELLLRYSAYLYALEDMRKTPDGMPTNYGASVPENIRQFGTMEERAFQIQNDALGAYDQISVLGQWLRRYIIPFWSWKEVNAKRYYQAFKNASRDERTASKVGHVLLGKAAFKTPYVAYKLGKWAIRASLFMAGVQAWNHYMYPDEEEELPDGIRNRPHIVLGRNKDGSVRYFNRIGALPDLLEWVDADDWPQKWQDYLNGRKSISDIAKEVAMAPVNQMWQGAAPYFKMPAELISRQETFPDLTRPRPIRDRGLYMAKSLGLDNEYRAIAGLPSRGYLHSLPNLFLYSIDPGEAAYNDILQKKSQFNVKIGKGRFIGLFDSPKSNALYNYKLSLRYGDRESAVKYLNEYIEAYKASNNGSIDGIKRAMEQSIKSMSPEFGISKKHQQQFWDYLTPQERRKFKQAIDFYDKTIMGENIKAREGREGKDKKKGLLK